MGDHCALGWRADRHVLLYDPLHNTALTENDDQ
jgi:hypothetical protein